MRYRAVTHHLSEALFGRSLCIRNFPRDAGHLTGIGMSDSDVYARSLASRIGYRNTFYDREPKLDIQDPPESFHRRFDFIISSDVLEHVAPPVEQACRNLHRLLAPRGALVLTVPFATEGRTIEHFPELYEYEIEKKDDMHVLRNRTRDGRVQEYANLRFHAGPGSTLEMRLLSEPDIRMYLAGAGFSDIQVHREPAFEWGIFWRSPWSVPITARA